MTDKRYFERIMRLNEDLATPIRSEPLSYALTMLLRALPDEDSGVIKQYALAVHAAFAEGSWGPHEATVRGRLHDALAAGRWGLVAVFPWTTDPEIPAQVNAIKSDIRAQVAGGDRLNQAAAMPTAPSPSDALTLVFRALAQGDDAEVTRLSLAVRDSFMNSSAL
jgi:hypothetical protein